MDGSTQPQPSPGIRYRFPELYEALREVAARVLGPSAPASLAPTELVHEGFLRMRAEELRRRADGCSELGEKPDQVFKACFGAACRDILVDRRRRRDAKKRGGGQPHEELHSTVHLGGGSPLDALAVHDALVTLAGLDPMLEQLVEARVFGGLTVPECAKFFGVSARTIDRKWAYVRNWLEDQLA